MYVLHITSSNSRLLSQAPASTPASAKPSTAEAAPASGTAISEGSAIETADFTHMTRQQLFDWMNDQLKSGKMTFEQSSPFLAMTLKIDANGQSVDMSTDRTVQDFTEVVRKGIEGARWRHDDRSEKMLTEALAIMQREQGRITKVDVTA